MKKFYCCILCLLFCFGCKPVEAKERILFIPIDDRPVCMQYTVDSLKAAGWDVLTPPVEYIASYNRNGDPDKLYDWLENNALLATDAIVSSDSLIYGGLVPSRTHELSLDILQARADKLLNFKNKFDCLRLYVFTTVMRSPRASSAPVEPSYYSQWGTQIFRMGELKDRQELGVIKKKESKELLQLMEQIPLTVQKDLYERRTANLTITKKLLAGVKNGAFDYFLLGRDDTAPYSDAHRDARALEILTGNLPQEKIRFFAGADQLGLVLLNRAVNKVQQVTPIVYTFYTEGVGAATIPTYEDEQVGKSIRNHILAAGGFPASSDKRADLILAVNTPVDGVCLSATNPKNNLVLTPAKEKFVLKVKDYVQQGKNVAIGDITYGNGADNALVAALFQEQVKSNVLQPLSLRVPRKPKEMPLAWALGAYAGWNTAGNTLGYALGQGLLREYLTNSQKNDLLAVRYLDEWVYQSNVRGEVRAKLIWPKGWTDGALKPLERKEAEQLITVDMHKFASKYFTARELNKWQYILPWSRMFEIGIMEKNK